MEELNKSFVPKLNEFSELLKQVVKTHADHIVTIGNRLKELKAENQELKQQMLENIAETDQLPSIDFAKSCDLFEKNKALFNEGFQIFIEETNLMLGKFSNHWGGYIEQLGVEFMLNNLRKKNEVHTWHQRFKRYWHKSQNIEIDLVAFSDDTVYMVEVKNQLKATVIQQISTNLDKIKTHCPEWSHLKIQPIVLAVHADENTIKTLSWGGIWVYRYKGFDLENPTDSWEWVKKETSLENE